MKVLRDIEIHGKPGELSLNNYNKCTSQKGTKPAVQKGKRSLLAFHTKRSDLVG